jgi:hypothetical protein
MLLENAPMELSLCGFCRNIVPASREWNQVAGLLYLVVQYLELHISKLEPVARATLTVTMCGQS